jgi:hypothetical protein
MSRVLVKETAIRQLVKELFDGDWTGPEDKTPVNVNGVVDPLAAQTNPKNFNYVPNNKVELQVAIKSLSSGLPDDEISGVYQDFIDAIEKNEKKDSEEKKKKRKSAEDKEMKKNQVENYIRLKVRKMLQEAMPIKGPGVRDVNEPVASAEEVKAWVPNVGMSAPRGYEIVKDKKGNEVTIQLKAIVPAGLEVTKVSSAPTISRMSQAAFEKNVKDLQRRFGPGKLDKSLSEPTSIVTPEMSIEAKLIQIFDDPNIKENAKKYAEIFMSASEQNPDYEWSDVISSKEFQSEFKEKFGTTFRNYAKEIGKEIRDKVSQENISSASKSVEKYVSENPWIHSTIESACQVIDTSTMINFGDERENEVIKELLKSFLRGITESVNYNNVEFEKFFSVLRDIFYAARKEHLYARIIAFAGDMPVDDEELGFSGSVQDLANVLGVSTSEIINLSDLSLFKFVFGLISGLATMLPDGNAKTGDENLKNVESKLEGFSRAFNSYVSLLANRGKLNRADVNILRENPEMVLELPGFKEYLRRSLKG